MGQTYLIAMATQVTVLTADQKKLAQEMTTKMARTRKKDKCLVIVSNQLWSQMSEDPRCSHKISSGSSRKLKKMKMNQWITKKLVNR